MVSFASELLFKRPTKSPKQVDQTTVLDQPRPLCFYLAVWPGWPGCRDSGRLEGQSFCEDGPRECPKCAPYLAQKGAGVPLWAPSLHWKAVESSGTLVFCLFWYWSTAWSLQNRKSRTVFQFSELYFLHSSIAGAWLSGSVPSHSIVCIATSASLSTACRPSAFRSTGGHSLQLLKMDEKGAPKRAAPMATIPSRILTIPLDFSSPSTVSNPMGFHTVPHGFPTVAPAT